MDNWFSAADPIIARLRAYLPPHVNVLTAAQLSNVRESVQPAPAVHLVHLPDRPGEIRRQGREQVWHQVWAAIVTVRNLSSLSTGQDAYQDAGPLILTTVQALSGWAPTDEHSPLNFQGGMQEGYTTGFAYFPLRFETQIVIRGEQ